MARAQDKAASFRGERPRGGEAQTTTGTGDDGDTIGQVQIHGGILRVRSSRFAVRSSRILFPQIIVRMLRRVALILVLLIAATGCHVKDDSAATPSIPPPADVAAPPADAMHTASGLASKVISIGFSNVKPGPTSTVRATYTGWTPDGRMFDSSLVHPGGQPLEFAVDQVIPGWTEGLQLMVVGEKRRFWIPGKLAYGDPAPGQPAWTGDPMTPPKGPLVFDVVLESVH
jgi:hypothetical protein